jgi:hypothetical protein
LPIEFDNDVELPTMREATVFEMVGVAQFVYRLEGPGAMTHNYLCAVCREHKAIIELNTGVLQPCACCRANGWSRIKKQKLSWWRRFFGI